jgi:hypothetical protein
MKVQILLIIMDLLVRASLVSRRVLLVGRKMSMMKSWTQLILKTSLVLQGRMTILTEQF